MNSEELQKQITDVKMNLRGFKGWVRSHIRNLQNLPLLEERVNNLHRRIEMLEAEKLERDLSKMR